MKVGDQIIYCPEHVKGDIKHPDVKFGFITKITRPSSAFCAFFTSTFIIDNEETGEGHHDLTSYDLVAGTERRIPLNRLIRTNHHDQSWIDNRLLDSGIGKREDIERRKAEKGSKRGGGG